MSVEVKLFNVYCREFYAQGGHNAIEQKLDTTEVDSGGATVACVHNEVASNCEACFLQVALLWSVVDYLQHVCQ